MDCFNMKNNIYNTQGFITNKTLFTLYTEEFAKQNKYISRPQYSEFVCPTMCDNKLNTDVISNIITDIKYYNNN